MVELILLFSFCALVGLGCLGLLGWVVVSAESVGVERIFLLLVFALLGALFLGMAAWLARFTRLQTLWKPAAATAKAAPVEVNPAKQKQAAPEETGKPAA